MRGYPVIPSDRGVKIRDRVFFEAAQQETDPVKLYRFAKDITDKSKSNAVLFRAAFCGHQEAAIDVANLFQRGGEEVFGHGKIEANPVYALHFLAKALKAEAKEGKRDLRMLAVQKATDILQSGRVNRRSPKIRRLERRFDAYPMPQTYFFHPTW